MIRLEQHDDVLRVRMRSAGSRAAGMEVCAYIVRGALVDCGFTRVGEALGRVLRERAIAGAIVTHWHEDHAGNVEWLARHGIPLQMAPDTEAILRAPPVIRFYRRAVWGSPPPLRSEVERFEHPALRAIHTPGHSHDHHVVWDAERETLFTGDLWLGVRARVLHTNEHPRLILESLRRVIALSPARMFDAHRGLVPDPRAALAAKARWLEDTIGTIERRIAEGWSDRRIVRGVLGGEELSGWISGGEYARRNLVTSIRNETVAGTGRG